MTTSFQNWKVSSTLALSTLVSFLLRLRAAWNATWAMRSISGSAVAHGVEGFLGAGEVAVDRGAATARLAEVDVAGQLADDQDVQARHQFGLQARGMGQLLVADRRAEVGEQAEVLAQAEDRLLGAQRALELVVLPVADGAEQHRVGRSGQRQRGLGQRVAMRLVGGTADQRGSISSGSSSALSTFTASAMISVPMPSPGRTAIFIRTSPRCGQPVHQPVLASLEQDIRGHAQEAVSINSTNCCAAPSATPASHARTPARRWP